MKSKKRLKTFWNENKGLFLFVFLMLAFRSAIADWSDVPTGSMKPTIVEGDRIVINKVAYDLKVPLTEYSLYKFAEPARGDIIVFNSAVADKRLVKRIVGVPGDQIAMAHNKLMINGEPLDYALLQSTSAYRDLKEDLVGIEHAVRLSAQPSAAANFNPVVVPEGHYLVLGDNRDNSADSRYIGFVPREEIVGRAKHVAFSLNYDNYFLPRRERFFARL